MKVIPDMNSFRRFNSRQLSWACWNTMGEEMEPQISECKRRRDRYQLMECPIPDDLMSKSHDM